MNKIYKGELGTEETTLAAKVKHQVADAIFRKPTWDIHRYESEAHYRQAKREERRIAEEILSMDMKPSANIQIPFYDEEEALDLFGMPEISHIEGNLLLNEGINEMWKLVAGTGGTQFNTATYMGVGDSTTAEDASQTELQASSNKLYIAMDGGYPTYGTNQYATWRATYTSEQANYAWQEYTLANGNSDSAVNLCRKVSSQGTKQSGQSWELTYQITMS